MVYGLSTWLPNLMIKAGYGITSGLSFALILNVGCVLGTILLSRIADKWIKARKLLVILYIVGTVCIAFLGFKLNTPVLYSLVFMVGVCVLCSQNIANAYVSQFYPSEIRSTGLGLCNTIGRWGGIFGPTLGGILLTLNLPMLFNFIVFAIASLICAIAYFAIRDRSDIVSTAQVIDQEGDLEVF